MSEGMEKAGLHINDRIEITIKNPESEVITTYLSRVDDISGGAITIAWPTSRGIRAPVHTDDGLSVVFLDGDSVYSVDCTILERVQEPNPYLVVRPEGLPQTIQRRDYVRVPATAHLTARILRAGLHGHDPAEDIPIITHTVNISGSGFAIHHNRPLEVGRLYDVKLMIPGDRERLVLTSKIMRCDCLPDSGDNNTYIVGFAFVRLKESLRRRLVRYVFQFQQNSIRRS